MPDFDYDAALSAPSEHEPEAFVYFSKQWAPYEYVLMLGTPKEALGVAWLRVSGGVRQFHWFGRYNQWRSLRDRSALSQLVARSRVATARVNHHRFADVSPGDCFSLDGWWELGRHHA